MKRILVIGSAGAGKTTFAKLLAQQASLPLIHLDAHYWKPGWIKPSEESWNFKVEELCDQLEWVMDGNFSSSLDVRLERADTVFFLDFGRTLCLYSVLKRLILHWGSVRDDMAEGCKESFDLGFLKWVWCFPINSRPRIISALAKAPERVNVHFIENRKELKKFLKEF